MKLQYLGDSKDSFKWDYHDFLAEALKTPTLDIFFMMTPDDNSRDGKTRPELYNARESIINFCDNIWECTRMLGTSREDQFYDRMKRLPQFTGAGYDVNIHRQHKYFNNKVRSEYFGNIPCNNSRLLFLDPDNSFEPERSCGEKHISYNDIHKLLSQLSNETVISVFHHFRRIPFADDFQKIKELLGDCHVTAIYWHSLMFVAVSKSKEAITCVVDANRRYSKNHPVKVIANYGSDE